MNEKTEVYQVTDNLDLLEGGLNELSRSTDTDGDGQITWAEAQKMVRLIRARSPVHACHTPQCTRRCSCNVCARCFE